VKILGADKPPLVELSHFGVKGMHWGTRKSSTTSGSPPPPTRKQLRGMNKAARARQNVERKQNIASDDAEIRDARSRVGEAYSNIRAAKQKFKKDKQMVGRVTAREILNKTTQKDYDILAKADEQTHHEAIGSLIGTAAGITLAIIAKSALR
jgi:hypothetical protein